MRILDCYLQRNMARRGGLLTEVVFVRATWEAADVAFLEKLIQLRAPDYRWVWGLVGVWEWEWEWGEGLHA